MEITCIKIWCMGYLITWYYGITVRQCMLNHHTFRTNDNLPCMLTFIMCMHFNLFTYMASSTKYLNNKNYGMCSSFYVISLIIIPNDQSLLNTDTLYCNIITTSHDISVFHKTQNMQLTKYHYIQLTITALGGLAQSLSPTLY